MSVHSQLFKQSSPLALESGAILPELCLAYECYGTLNKDKSNAILICHALSGDAHAAFERHDDTRSLGWWDGLIGPGKAIDTNRFFVICSNTIGSCYGSTGPSSINPETQSRYALSFPIITISDMVKAQFSLISSLEIPRLKAVIGGSMGGMQALEWAISYPDALEICIPIATTTKLSPQALAFGAVGRKAILSDPHFRAGNYNDTEGPKEGLAIARMIGHITYLSEESMGQKFGRKLQKKTDYGYDFTEDFQIESYLKYQGDKFVSIFDANSYLYLSRAMSYFDLEKQHSSLQNAFSTVTSRFLILSLSSDWLYPSKQSIEIAKTLMKMNKQVSYSEIETPYGHDAFLIEHEKMTRLIKPFLESSPAGAFQ